MGADSEGSHDDAWRYIPEIDRKFAFAVLNGMIDHITADRHLLGEEKIFTRAKYEYVRNLSQTDIFY